MAIKQIPARLLENRQNPDDPPVDFRTGTVRVRFHDLFEPRAAVKDATPSYSVTVLVPKSDTETITMAKQVIKNAIQLKAKPLWKGKVPPIERFHLFLTDGDDETIKGWREEYRGHYVIKAKSGTETRDGRQLNPPLVLRRPKPMVIATKDDLNNGDYVSLVLRCDAYSNGTNTGVTAYVNTVLLAGKGEPFPSVAAAAATDDLEDMDWSDDEDDYDMEDGEDPLANL